MASKSSQPSVDQFRWVVLAAFLVAWLVAGWGVQAAETPRPKKIVLIAGDPDGHPAATHEYAQSVRLAKALPVGFFDCFADIGRDPFWRLAGR